MKKVLIGLLALGTISANAGVDFDKLDCSNSKHQIHVEKLNNDQMKVSIYRLVWDEILPPREKIAKVQAYSQVVNYQESHARISTVFESVIGETIFGTKIKKTINLRIKESTENNIVAEYNRSGEIKCK